MVNYPNGRKCIQAAGQAKIGAGDRGMELEKEINVTNEFYLSNDRAVIHKKPTPVTIVKVDYPTRSAARITEAYFKLPSTTDYNGIYRGRYIDFEAKECQSRTSFPIKSIHAHQIEHLDAVTRHGAIAFVIVRFVQFDETWLVNAADMSSYIRTCGRSSIPYQWFCSSGFRVPRRFVAPVDYLAVVDQVYFKESQTS